MKSLILTGSSLTLDALSRAAHAPADRLPKISIAPKARARAEKAHRYVQSLARGNKAIYGVNTGFGLLSDVRISKDKLAQLQINLLRSHAAGVGPPLSRAEVRAALILRINTLCKGHSGVSTALLDTLVEMINRDVVPWVPEQGSVGACGDLAPLAHLALVAIGEGRAYWRGKIMSGAQAMRAAKIRPHKLQAKEGLALINGTQIMTAIGALTLIRAKNIVRLADIAGAISLEAVRGTTKAFHPKIQAVRAHPEQADVAQNLRKLLSRSAIAESHKDCGRVQDPYSFRCMPQVHGAARAQLNHAERILATEVNSATDNPLVFLPEDLRRQGDGPQGGELISGGNFHGEFVAMALDGLAIGLAEIANISDLRMQKLINPAMSGLPAFLTSDPGLNSGLMIVQVAAASLVSENKVLAHPASVDSIPTSADKEDHVSMGVTAARKARQILDNVSNVLAMEFLCGTQGLEFLRPLRAGRGAQAAYECVRTEVKPIKADRPFHEDITAIRALMDSGELLAAAEKSAGELC